MSGPRIEGAPQSGYAIYNEKAKRKTRINTLERLYPPLPDKKFSILYADPPWHYNGKLQYDLSATLARNEGWRRDVFVSAASFKYPTIETRELKKLAVESIAEDDSLLFMWATNPHLQQAIELGVAWGFEYKTVAFVWNKMAHNPGQYTLSYCELCLLFKRGRIPQPRGARNIGQLINRHRKKHSEKPDEAAENIEKMFPTQTKIELFARARKEGWHSWGLEAIKRETATGAEGASTSAETHQRSEGLDAATGAEGASTSVRSRRPRYNPLRKP